MSNNKKEENSFLRWEVKVPMWVLLTLTINAIIDLVNSVVEWFI